MAFNPATSLRNFIKNSPWVFMAIAVHVIALSVLAIWQFAKQPPKVEDTPTVVKLAAPQEKPPEDTLPPEVLDRKAIPKNEEAEIVAARALELSEKHKITSVTAFSRCLLGHARAQLGRPADGIELIRRGITEALGTGSRILC